MIKKDKSEKWSVVYGEMMPLFHLEDDPMPFEKENQALRNKHPELIDYRIYQDIAHNIHYEQPERFTANLINFLKKSLK